MPLRHVQVANCPGCSYEECSWSQCSGCEVEYCKDCTLTWLELREGKWHHKDEVMCRHNIHSQLAYSRFRVEELEALLEQSLERSKTSN